MELRQLRYFIALAEELSFSRAAERLYISQPALSQQIADLEREAGVALVVRGRQLELTGAGRLLESEARELVSRSDALIPKLRQADEQYRDAPVLMIALDPSDVELDRYGVINALVLLQQRYPGLSLQLKALPYERAADAIEQGEAHIGLYMVTDYEAQFIRTSSYTVSQERFCLMVPSTFILTHPNSGWRSALERYPLFIRSADTRWKLFFTQSLRRAVPNITVKYSESHHFIESCVRAGLGVSIVSEQLAFHEKKSYTTPMLIDMPGFSARDVILWKDDDKNPILNEFLSMFRTKE